MGYEISQVAAVPGNPSRAGCETGNASASLTRMSEVQLLLMCVLGEAQMQARVDDELDRRAIVCNSE